MKLTQLTASALTAASLLVSVLPAQAGPFDLQRLNSAVSVGNVLQPAGNAGNANTNSSTPQPTSTIGNTEIQGLGDHQSWIDSNNLAEDHRAYCSDVGLGNNTVSTNSRNTLSTDNRRNESRSSTKNDGGGGGGSFLGIVSVSGSGSTQGSNNENRSSTDILNRSDAQSSTTSTVATGKNCDAFVESAASRDMNHEDNLTERYRIKVGRRGDQVNNLITEN